MSGAPDEATLVAALYTVPLAEFVAHRKDAATQLRQAGQRDAANRVKALTKPTAAAWAANALHRQQRAGWDAMLEAAARLRAAQAEGGQTPQRMQALVEAQRAALGALLRKAPALCASVGQKLSRDHEGKLRATLEALCTGVEAVAGQLSDDLTPRRFDAFAAGGFAPRAPAAAVEPIAPDAPDAAASRRVPTGEPPRTAAAKAPPAVRPTQPTVTPRDRERAHALQQLRDLESIRDARTAQRDRARAQVRAATEELERARAEVSVARRRLARAEEEAATLAARLRESEAERARLGDAVRDAQEAVARANAALTTDST